MNAKRKDKVIIARSQGALAAHLRGGAGKHLDRRTKRQRTRATQFRAALQD